MKPSAGGKDEVRVEFIRFGGPRALEHLVKVVQYMRLHPHTEWDDLCKLAIVIPLYKSKGDWASLDSTQHGRRE